MKADQVFEQGPGQIRKPEVGRAEAGDFFGGSIVVGQFNDGGPVDIAVGAPGEDVGTKPDAGAVRVMYSRGSSGVSTVDADFFHQDSKDLDGMAEAGDRFACSLA
ncbi:MAG: esterase, partial [Actinomycetota bacterium]